MEIIVSGFRAFSSDLRISSEGTLSCSIRRVDHIDYSLCGGKAGIIAAKKRVAAMRYPWKQMETPWRVL